MRLILFEVRQWLKRPLFWAMVLMVGLFVGSQLGEGNFWQEIGTGPKLPEPGLEATQENSAPYGWYEDNSPDAQMEQTNRNLYFAAHGNPVHVPALGGFINREVRFSDSQLTLIGQALTALSGKPFEQIGSFYDDMPAAIPYEAYEERLETLNKALGGNYFQVGGITGGAYVPRTYEQALADYQALTAGKALTPAYARIYSDYMGIALGLFPALLAAFILGRDKRSGAQALIGARPTSGVKYLFVKYLGYVLPVCALVLLAACILTTRSLALAAGGYTVDWLAYLWYSGVWLVPVVLSTCGAAMLAAEVAGTSLAGLPVALLWWVVSVARPGLAGPYPLYVALIRFNQLGPIPQAWAHQALVNRLFITALAFAMVALSGAIHERKRGRGGRYV